MPDTTINTYVLTYAAGLELGYKAVGTPPRFPSGESLPDIAEAVLIVIESGLMQTLEPIKSLEGFLMGLGTPEPALSQAKPLNVISHTPPRLSNAVRMFVESLAQEKEELKKNADLLSDETGRNYKHSVIPRLVAAMLGDIFGEGRDPGHVLDEAIASRFNVTNDGHKCEELKLIAKRARSRLGGHPEWQNAVKLLIKAITDHDPQGISDNESIARLTRLLFDDDPVDHDATRIAMGMYLGGLLGAICLSPFQSRFSTEKTIGDWSSEETRNAREWMKMTADSSSAADALHEWGDIRALEPLRQLGWLPSTDFLLNLGTLGEGAWFYDFDVDRTGLQDHLLAKVREGSMLAIWRSGGRQEMSPAEATLPSIVRTHNFNRDPDRSNRWDLSVSLGLLADGGFTLPDSSLPHPERIEEAVADAVASQHWEIAEALMSLWLLYLTVPSFIYLPTKSPADLLIRQKQQHPHEYGFLGPTARYLLMLSRTREYFDLELQVDLEEICKHFTSGEPETQDPRTITASAARTELVGGLVGPVFLQLPSDVRSKLVEVVLRRKLLDSHSKAGKFRHFGADTVALANVLEVLLRDRFRELSLESLGILESMGVLPTITSRTGMTLGPMVMALKKFQQYPNSLQEELNSVFRCLPLSRSLRDKLFALIDLRNKGAHEGLELEDYHKAWDILFSTSYKQAIETPGVLAVIGQRFA